MPHTQALAREVSGGVLVDSTAGVTVLERSMKRRILLTVAKRNSKHCPIGAPAERTVAFQGYTVDARALCCGHFEAGLVVSTDRRRLTDSGYRV
jgi:hypothetical protein